MERVILAQAYTAHHLRSETHERDTDERLRDESHGGDLSTVQVAAAEKMPVVGSSADLLLVLVGDDHHLDVGIKIKFNAVDGGGDLCDGGFGLVNATLPHQPPRRLRGEKSCQDDGNRPDPL